MAKWSIWCKNPPYWRISPYSQSSDRPLHCLLLPFPQDLIIVCLSTMLIAMDLFLYSRIKREKIQIFRVTLRLFLDNLINKTTPGWNLKTVKMSRRKYYGTVNKREKVTILACAIVCTGTFPVELSYEFPRPWY